MNDRVRETAAQQGRDLRPLIVAASAGDAGSNAVRRRAPVQCRLVAGMNDFRGGHERVTGATRAFMNHRALPHSPRAGYSIAASVDTDDDVPGSP